MRWFIILSILIVAFSYAQGQDNDKLYEMLTQYRTHDCLDMEVNAKMLIPELYNRGELDSVNMIINYVESKCETREFDILKILIDIELGKFEPDWCDSTQLAVIFHPFFYSIWDIYFMSRYYSQYEVQIYQDFIRGRAFSLTAYLDTNSVEYLLCRYYSNNVGYFMTRLRANSYDGFCIQEKYNQYTDIAKQDLRKNRGHYSFEVGMWNPPNDNDILGFTTELSFTIGYRPNKWGFDATCSFRIPFSTNEYQIILNDTLATTDFFTGIMAGGQITREIFYKGRFELEGFFGLAYDSFNAIEGDKGDKSIESFCWNFGATARLFYNRTRSYFFGLKFRYNVVDYNNAGGTDFSGNTYSICLVYGKLANEHAIFNADYLRLFD